MSAHKVFLPPVLCAVLVSLSGSYTSQDPHIGPAEVVHEWVFLDYDWQSAAVKRQYIQDGRYDPTHNLIISYRFYGLATRTQFFLLSPLITEVTTGVPSTLNRLVRKGNQTLLSPYPDWASNELGNCDALQCVVGIEIDKTTGHIYVVDAGRSGIFSNITDQPPPVLCPGKLVVYDLKDGSLVWKYIFPENVAAMATNFLDDIVFDRGDAQSTTVKWVHITDITDGKLVTLNLETNQSHFYQDPTMFGEPGSGSDYVINGKFFKIQFPVNGIAMSPDFRYVYYSALGSKKLYQIPTRILRYPGRDFAGNVRLVGSKVTQSDAMTHTTDNLYYAALTQIAVYRWEITKDELVQGVDEGQVKLRTERKIAQDNERMQWMESFFVDEHGYLWFTSIRVQLFLFDNLDLTGAQGANFRVWRIKILEKGYLALPGLKSY